MANFKNDQKIKECNEEIKKYLSNIKSVFNEFNQDKKEIDELPIYIDNLKVIKEKVIISIVVFFVVCIACLLIVFLNSKNVTESLLSSFVNEYQFVLYILIGLAFIYMEITSVMAIMHEKGRSGLIYLSFFMATPFLALKACNNQIKLANESVEIFKKNQVEYRKQISNYSDLLNKEQAKLMNLNKYNEQVNNYFEAGKRTNNLNFIEQAAKLGSEEALDYLGSLYYKNAIRDPYHIDLNLMNKAAQCKNTDACMYFGLNKFNLALKKFSYTNYYDALQYFKLIAHKDLQAKLLEYYCEIQLSFGNINKVEELKDIGNKLNEIKDKVDRNNQVLFNQVVNLLNSAFKQITIIKNKENLPN